MTSDKRKSFPWKGVVNYTLSLLLTAVFLYIAFHGVDLGELLNIISRVSFFWIFVFISIQFLAHYLRTIRWKIILKSVKPETRIKNLFGALMVGYGVNTVLPRVGEITRAVLLGRWEGISRSSAFGTVILERIIDMIILGFAVLGSVWIWQEDLYKSFPWLRSALILTMLLLGAIILVIYLLIRFREKFKSVALKITGRFSEKISGKITHIFDLLLEGFSSLKGGKNYFYTIALSIIIILLYSFDAFIGFYIVGMQNQQTITLEMGWIVMSISAIGVVIPTPGGTGSYHTMAKTTLVLLFGFGEAVSLAYAFITHLITNSVFIFSSVIIFFVLNKQHENLIKVMKTDIENL